MGKYVIAGNWKMNKTPAEATELIEAIKPLVKDATCDVVVGVPFVDLCAALEAVKGSNIGVAAQNCHWEKSGAYTGEISAEMLKAMGVGYVILGHSERRTYFGDTDVTVQKRMRAALDAACPRKNWPASSSRMSPCGPSVPAAPPPLSRPTRYAPSFVRPLPVCTTGMPRRLSPSSTAAP